MSLSERLARLPPALRAVVVLLVVFVPLLIVFLATGEPVGDAIVQAVFWAVLAVFAAAVGGRWACDAATKTDPGLRNRGRESAPEGRSGPTAQAPPQGVFPFKLT